MYLMYQILDHSVPKSTTLWSGSGEKGGEFSLHVLRAFKGPVSRDFQKKVFFIHQFPRCLRL